ncbi:uncharacterized protein LOC112349295 isoform X1 [Selaginella moellendorffii]|uniref:uncharacterized protein LOC112349295 isoform X1 n=1 Tax=Selaginella moellendorffii TaxID=88036 RepID=UPI000D1C98D0|nr:uncharacterized protein LOC112349295 isoform X1 [Selaginella moellendorffii]|eukprot:XP_024539271.1 uncharacterized protein LOC112349295 isoform X1 [Selaginella moellendorffii]
MSERNIHETTLETKRLQGKEEKRGGGERGGGEREIITNFPWRLQIKHVKASVFNHKYRASSSCCCRQSSKHNFKVFIFLLFVLTRFSCSSRVRFYRILETKSLKEQRESVRDDGTTLPRLDSCFVNRGGKHQRQTQRSEKKRMESFTIDINEVCPPCQQPLSRDIEGTKLIKLVLPEKIPATFQVMVHTHTHTHTDGYRSSASLL